MIATKKSSTEVAGVLLETRTIADEKNKVNSVCTPSLEIIIFK